MRSRRSIALIGILATFALTVGACGSDRDDVEASGDPSAAETGGGRDRSEVAGRPDDGTGGRDAEPGDVEGTEPDGPAAAPADHEGTRAPQDTEMGQQVGRGSDSSKALVDPEGPRHNEPPPIREDRPHPEPGEPTEKAAKGDTVDPAPRPFESYSSDGDELRVYWWGGVEPCHTVDRVEVTESPTAVTVTVYEGADRAAYEEAGGGGPFCPAIAAEFKSEPLVLGSALGTRAVVDGSTGAPVPQRSRS